MLTSSAVVRQENVRNIIRERKMLEHLNHPFLCNLRYSFQDYEYLCARPSPDRVRSMPLTRHRADTSSSTS